MAKKLYKRQYTQNDIMILNQYVMQNGVMLLVEIWREPNGDGEVYELTGVSDVAQGINITDKYYDNLAGYPRRSAELILREKNGEYEMFYHTDKFKSGISIDALNYSVAKFINKNLNYVK